MAFASSPRFAVRVALVRLAAEIFVILLLFPVSSETDRKREKETFFAPRLCSSLSNSPHRDSSFLFPRDSFSPYPPAIGKYFSRR